MINQIKRKISKNIRVFRSNNCFETSPKGVWDHHAAKILSYLFYQFQYIIIKNK